MDIDTNPFGMLRYVQIGGDKDGNAVVTLDIRGPLPIADHAAYLHDLAAAGQAPEGEGFIQVEATTEPRCKGEIEIDVGHDRGTCAVMIRFEPKWGRYDGAQFCKKKPFGLLPTNHPEKEDFLFDFRCYPTTGDDERRCASFMCDLDVIRMSALARRVADLNPKIFHNDRMRVPFVYNAIDPLLDFSPWVLPVEARHPIFTHGGVHPNISSFLLVSL